MSVIKLSASSIQDYVECRKRFWYRIHKSSEAIQSDNMIFGSIIHEAVEKFDDISLAREFFWKEWNSVKSQSFLPDVDSPPKDVERILNGYYNKILPKIPKDENSKRELFFEVPWGENQFGEKVEIIGKIDRIADNVIYDWKTTSSRPSQYVLQSIQFYVYHYAYEQLYNKYPDGIYYGHLYTGSLYPVELKKSLIDNLQVLIEDISNNINNFYRITGYQCSRCMFRDICYRELENELAR